MTDLRASQREYDNREDGHEELDEDLAETAAQKWIDECYEEAPEELIDWVISNKWDEVCAIAEEISND